MTDGGKCSGVRMCRHIGKRVAQLQTILLIADVTEQSYRPMPYLRLLELWGGVNGSNE